MASWCADDCNRWLTGRGSTARILLGTPPFSSHLNCRVTTPLRRCGDTLRIGGPGVPDKLLTTTHAAAETEVSTNGIWIIAVCCNARMSRARKRGEKKVVATEQACFGSRRILHHHGPWLADGADQLISKLTPSDNPSSKLSMAPPARLSYGPACHNDTGKNIFNGSKVAALLCRRA